MSLRSRIAYLLVALSFVLVMTMYAVQVMVVMPTFVDLERTEATRDVDRCLYALERDIQSISNSTNDWASWDDTYEYIQDHNAKYELANLVDESFTNAHLNLFCFVDRERRVVWGEVRDTETLEKIDVPDLFAAIQQASSPLTNHDVVDDAVTGILLTSKGPMLLASRPILSTKHKGPIMGTLVMGRFLSQSEIDNLAERNRVKLKIWTISQAHMPVEAQRIVDNYPLSHESHIETVDRETLQAYRVMDDVYGKPALLLRVDVPRVVTAQGRVAIRVATICSLAGGVVILAMMWIVLERGIVHPLRHMAAHSAQVGRSGNLKARLNLSRTDEIGTLAHEFDRMVENLAEFQKKVLDAAHLSGKAEVASEVLHNVGNAVNSVTYSVEMLRARLEESKVVGFERAAKLLREQAPHAAEFFGVDPRGPKLVDYLLGLSEALQQENRDQQSEVDRLFKVVRHIVEVITAQQAYTGQAEFRQEVNFASLLDEVLLLNQNQIQAHQIEVEVDLPPLPELHLNESKIIQVLMNLVRNAIQAMQDQQLGVRRLTISARLVDEGGLEVEVRDTGHGFDDEVRAKVFAPGFTTRPNGSGNGLHYCANAVQGAGGQIWAESPGIGQGAKIRFRLVNVLPLSIAAT